MPASPAHTTTPTILQPPGAAAAPGKSLLARIKSPFGNKTRSLTEFHIKPDDPHRQYSPGDIIAGSVILNVVKPIRVTHIVVALHGYVQVYKNPNSPAEGYRAHHSSVASGRGRRVGGYFGNGFASLFEDEVVLCGEGRLAEGKYQFNFELEFPSKGLPSSIDFERGTISYMLTSTMTRPTTIMPTASCDRKVYLVETIDIAPLFRPKARVVSLERISRRSRAKSKVRMATGGDQPAAQTPTELSHKSSRVSELSSAVEESEAPQSPAPSDTSFDSHLSGSQGGSSSGSGPFSFKTGDVKRVTHKGSLISQPPVTATIELLKAGFLRGDNVPLKISVNHTKHFQSLRGIIVTLYRQARVDMHPAIPVVMNGKSDKSKGDDYYPKSKTGLGGLSLSSSGSSHVFRKDLSQSFAPLIVDPRTRTADVKASVRVPDEAFPTISSVPGAMISFKYYVEVVVDLQGKLTGLDKYFSNSGMMLSMPAAYGAMPAMARAEDNNSSFAAWGGHFLDTEPLRRDKGVVSCVFEVIVGTKDSDRRKEGKRKAVQPDTDDEHSQQAFRNDFSPAISDGYNRAPATDPNPPGLHDIVGQADYFYNQHVPSDSHPYTHPAYPVPEWEDEAALPEKERLRRAEERLLPSQPPQASDDASPAAAAPSAPIIPEEQDHAGGPPSFPYHLSLTPTTAIAGPSTAPQPSAHPPDAFSLYPHHDDPAHPSAPTYEEHEGSAFSSTATAGNAGPSSQPTTTGATDDKQELQRRGLEAQRSAPALGETSAPETAGAAVVGTGTGTVEFAPSAPVLSEEEEFGFDVDFGQAGDLPRYER